MYEEINDGPVNLAQLRGLTDGNLELEQSLFELFITSADENLEYLDKNCAKPADLEWKRNAHSLKGAARNIGAEKLGSACSHAQDIYATATESEKLAAVARIQQEYVLVKDFLNKVHQD